MANLSVAGFVLALVALVLGLSPAKEWLKLGLPWIWPDYWFPTGTNHSSHHATNSRGVGQGRRSGRPGNPTSNEQTGLMILRQVIEAYGDLKVAYDRLLADNGTVRDSLNAVSIELRDLDSNGRDRVAANSDHDTPALPESSTP